MNKIKINWEKAKTCKHESLTNYHAWGSCATPGCGGWDEYHCKDCGIYFSKCRCGSEEGFDSISSKRRKSIMKRR